MGSVQIPKMSGVAGLPNSILVDTGKLYSALLISVTVNRSCRGISLWIVAIHIQLLGHLQTN